MKDKVGTLKKPQLDLFAGLAWLSDSLQSHPLSFASELVDTYPEIEKLEFSVYAYSPQSVKDNRILVPVRAADVVPLFLNMLSWLRKNEEIAFHSRVLLRDGSIRHLPMIDFKGEIREEHRKQIIDVAVDFGCKNVYLYFSGRSYHMYAMNLLDHDTWLKFMGRILLLNLPDLEEIVDSRWVGHRLVGGYGSLRWTRNSSHYVNQPELRFEANLKSPVCSNGSSDTGASPSNIEQEVLVRLMDSLESFQLVFRSQSHTVVRIGSHFPIMIDPEL